MTITNPESLQSYQAPANLLEGKNILVTGASKGIGETAALTYARHGATVILLGRDEQALDDIYDQIEKENGPQPIIVPFDLMSDNEAQYQELASHISNELGALHGLLHNAALLGELKPLGQYSYEMFREVMAVNVNSHFLLTKALIPALESADNASIVFTSSSVGRKGRAYWGAYSISKFAVEGMMQIWAEELSGVTNIRVNSINPGATKTAMRAKAYPAEDRSKLPEASEIMGAYLYLMGDDSLSLNGQQLDARIR